MSHGMSGAKNTEARCADIDRKAPIDAGAQDLGNKNVKKDIKGGAHAGVEDREGERRVEEAGALGQKGAPVNAKVDNKADFKADNKADIKPELKEEKRTDLKEDKRADLKDRKGGLEAAGGVDTGAYGAKGKGAL